jgi:hypothetical protein
MRPSSLGLAAAGLSRSCAGGAGDPAATLKCDTRPGAISTAQGR